MKPTVCSVCGQRMGVGRWDTKRSETNPNICEWCELAPEDTEEYGAGEKQTNDSGASDPKLAGKDRQERRIVQERKQGGTSQSQSGTGQENPK